MAQLPNKTGPFVGPLQPTKSRLPESRVWCITKRPGPAEYTLATTFGKVADSTKVSAQGTRFGSEPRDGTLLLPSVRNGKGTYYGLPGSMGSQSEARKATSPRPHFGTSGRDNYAALYNAFTYKPH